ncbi:MAG TPA: CHAD domain-containing protein [Myxococcales bacterium]
MLAPFLAVIERQEPALPEKDAVHDARVACRRLRAALRLLGLRELDGPVKDLQDALGEVRDLQLQAEWLRPRDERLHRQRAALIRKATRALVAAVRRWHTHTLPLLIQADVKRPPAKKVRKILRRRLAKLEERLEAARDRPTPRAMHRARISVKQVRYLLELAPALPRRAKARVADLKSLQASLGELHDVDVRIALLRGRRALLREQREARARLLKVALAQLSRWHKQRVAQKARDALR